MRQVLPLPYEVDPLIKLSRWSMLVAGLIYGFRRRRELAIIEHEFRIRETKRKAELAKVLAEEKVIANADELEQLEQMFLGKDTDNNNLDEE